MHMQFLKLMGEDDEESRKLTKDAAELAKAVDIMDESTKEKQGSGVASFEFVQLII